MKHNVPQTEFICLETDFGFKRIFGEEKESKPYKSGDYSEIFDASERMVMEPDEAVAYEQCMPIWIISAEIWNA